MDLGCMDLGCIEKQSTEAVDSEPSANGSAKATSKFAKNKAKEAGQSNISALNKFTSQIKKPPHRRTSPLNWFPRKKVDSYLKRKIKLLQEIGGMNATLDETLGDSNPHYSRVLKEKIAVKGAAQKAIEARKAAMVEASWCRILQAARIPSKEAEATLVDTEKAAEEAFEEAKAIGVIMYDMPDCSRKHYEIETSSSNGGGSTTHTVTASFETAFEVDKQVAAAVKAAFVKLASCPSINKDEFKELLRKISENPDTSEGNQELSEFSSECESDTGSQLESGFHKDTSQNNDRTAADGRQTRYKKQQLDGKFSMTKLVDMMLERLKCLQDDELASLAIIVATCGLNAALAEAENSKLNLGSTSALNFGRDCSTDGQMRGKQVDAELPSLDKFLVKHLTRLEKELQEAKSARIKGAREDNGEKQELTNGEKWCSVNGVTSAEAIPELGSILVKHRSKLEKEIAEAKKKSQDIIKKKRDATNEATSSENGEKQEFSNGEKGRSVNNETSAEAIPDLGSILVKHSSKLEKEIAEAKKKSQDIIKKNRNATSETTSSEASSGLEDVLIKKHFSKLEREIEETKRNSQNPYETKEKKPDRTLNGLCNKNDVANMPSLDQLLVRHVSKLEKEVQEAKNRRNFSSSEGGRVTQAHISESSKTPCSDSGQVGKENIDLNKEANNTEFEMGPKETDLTLSPDLTKVCSSEPSIQIGEATLQSEGELSHQDREDESQMTENSLAKILVKPVHRLEREKIQASQLGNDNGTQYCPKKKEGANIADHESLDKVLVKHVSRLEKEKMAMVTNELVQVKRRQPHTPSEVNNSSLDQILIKHKSKLEKEKMTSALQLDDQVKSFVSRREARERELQEAWGGLSLGNSMHPRLSRLEREKAAWQKAEEEERRKVMEEV
ncbi:hypothetical protein NMG60_11021233 [Bertholletia excelsa]